MNIKEFFATLGIELDQEDFDAADEALASVEKGLEWVATGAIAATAALGAMVLSTASEASEISKLAALMGVGAEQAQEWAYAAQQSGLSADDLGQLVAELAENLGEASGGTGEAADAFKSLGLELKDSNGKLKETPVALAEIADKLAGMADGQQKTAAITGLFGEEGIKLLGILNQGSEGIARYAQEARDLGLIMEKDTVEGGKELTANLNTLQSTIVALAAQVAGPFIKDLNELFKSLREWWKLNGRLVGQRMEKVLTVVAVVLRVLVRVLLALAKALAVVIDNFSLLAIILGSVLTAIFISQLKWHLLLISSWFRVGAAAAWAGMQAMWAWIKAAAPIIAIAALIALVVLVFEDLYMWITGGNSLFAQLWEKFKKFIKEWSEPAFGDGWLILGIKALLRGLIAIGEYFPILIEDIKQIWNTAVEWMRGLYNDMLDDVIAGANTILDMLPGGQARKISRISSIAQQVANDQRMSDAIAAGTDPFSRLSSGWQSLTSGQALSGAVTAAKTLTDNRTLTVNLENFKGGKEAADQFIDTVKNWWGGELSDTKGAQ